MAFALFFGGILVSFIGFNFASGTNDFGLIMILAGIVVGGIAIISGLVGIVFGWMAWNSSGRFYWLIAACSVPFVQAIAYFVVRHATK